jgi:hypothetical protein
MKGFPSCGWYHSRRITIALSLGGFCCVHTIGVPSMFFCYSASSSLSQSMSYWHTPIFTFLIKDAKLRTYPRISDCFHRTFIFVNIYI